MLKSYELAFDAREDLKKAWFYTRDKWGENQANSYVLAIESRIWKLLEDHPIGTYAPSLGKDIQWSFVNKHTIYYKVQGDILHVLHILGPGQDKYQRFGTS